MGDQVSIGLCGRLSVQIGGRACTAALPGRQGRLALIYLALHHDRPVSRDELADAIWAEHAPPAAARSLNALLSKLRRALGPGVVEGTASLQLVERVSVDLDDARAMLADAQRGLAAGDCHRARERAASAADLAGRGLVCDHEADWLEDERRNVEDLRLRALDCVGEAALGLGGHALAEAERVAVALIAASPYRESGYLLKMRALAAHGDVAEAVRVYHDLRRTLDEELGIPPGAQARALAERLLAGDGEATGSVAPARGGSVVPTIAPPRFATRTHAHFVGRERELERLGALLELARRGRRQLVLVEGEPGIGKTRLAERFAASARAAGVNVLAGGCDAEALVPYQPFVQAVRPYVAAVGADRLRERLGVRAQELACLLPDLAADGAPVEQGGGRAERFQLFEAVCALLTEIISGSPAVLILDDLQWADPTTLLLLRHVVRAAEDAPLLILGLYRDTERPAHLLATLAELRREQFFETIRLAGLDQRNASALIATLSDRPADTDADRALWLETKGNPFFLEEMARQPPQGRLRAIPEGTRTVLRQRLAGRSDEAHRVLAAAAVVGQEFSIEVLERVRDLSDLRESGLEDALDETLAAQAIVEIPDEYGRFAFAHSLMRQTIYDDMTIARRARLHLGVGEALEALRADGEPRPLAELAHHFLAAPPSRAAEKAIHYAIAAGDEAMRVLAFEEAERLYRLALTTLERRGQHGGPLRRVLLALGDVQVKLGSSRAARETYGRALALARDDGDAEAFALAALGLGARSFMAGGVFEAEVIAMLEEALERLPTGDSALRARLLGRLADELSFSDQRGRCASLTREAVDIAHRVGEPRAYGFALASRHWCLWEPENLPDRLAAARELLALGARTGQKAISVEGHRWCMLDLLELGDIDAVDTEIEAYSELARERRLASELWYIPLFRAMRMLLDGRLGDVERVADEALRLGRRAQPANAEQAHTLQLVALRREHGRLAETEKAVRASAQRYPAIPGWRSVLAYVYGDTGQLERAAHELDALAADEFSAIPHDGLWLGAIAHLAETCVAVGARAHAAKLYDLLAPYGDRNVVIGWASSCAGSAARHLGLVAALLGNTGVAAAHFEQAIAMNRRMGAVPWLARTQLQYAQAMLNDPRLGTAEQAAELLTTARASAQEFELRDIAERTETALAAARQRRARVPAR